MIILSAKYKVKEYSSSTLYFLYKPSPIIMIYSLCYRLYTGNRKGVFQMEILISFIVAVAGGVACHYIIKWLDGDK